MSGIIKADSERLFAHCFTYIVDDEEVYQKKRILLLPPPPPHFLLLLPPPPSSFIFYFLLLFIEHRVGIVMAHRLEVGTLVTLFFTLRKGFRNEKQKSEA